MSPLLQSLLNRLNAGEIEPVEAELKTLLVGEPGNAMAHNLLGFVAQRRGQRAAAVAAFQQAATLAPDRAPFHFNLAVALRACGRAAEAIAPLTRALGLSPEDASYWQLMGQCRLDLQDYAVADEALRRAALIQPGHAAVLHELARSLSAQGRREEAVLMHRHALLLQPEDARGQLQLGLLYRSMGLTGPATTHLRRSLQIDPNQGETHLALAATLYGLRQYPEALAHLTRAETLSPREAAVHNNFGMVYNAMGESALATRHFRQALTLAPGHASAHSNLLLHLNYQDTTTPAAMLAEAMAFAARHTPASIQPHPNAREPGRRLKIGYLSGEFRKHAVGLFVLPLFEHHDHRQFEIFAYAEGAQFDATSQRMQTLVDHWRPVANLSDAQLIAQIRADGIDILVELSGHTGDNRLPALAHQPAPVQISWLGYPGTTGLKAIGYVMSDAVADPLNETRQMIEAPLHLPGGFHCYRPEGLWQGELEPRAASSLAAGRVTFGSFNNLAKVSPTCIRMWAAILRAVPAATLVMKGKPFSEAAARARFVERFAAENIDASRVTLRAYDDTHAAHMQIWAGVDIHLDSAPYNGVTTTCDALWMGVPVITLRGNQIASRTAASLLTHAGCADWIADSEADYVRKAVALAADLPRLAGYRHSLREQFKASPLSDAVGFARKVEDAYRAVWMKTCGGQASEGRASR